MEFLNKVEIKGIVGKVKTHYCTPEKQSVSFNVVTEHQYKEMSGEVSVDTQWWNCYAYDNENALSLQRGDKVHVIGRLRYHRFIEETGVIPMECVNIEILASEVEKLED